MKKKMAVYQNNKLIYPQVEIASNFFRRLHGLMGKQRLEDGEGLLLLKCSGVHTCFMRFPIDVVYLDADFRVLEYDTVRPWSLGSFVKGTKSILELPAAGGKRLKKGIPLILSPCDSLKRKDQ